MNITISKATVADLPFVENIYVDGISCGHFNLQPGLPINKMLQDWLRKNSITRATVRKDGTQLIEEVLINFYTANIDGKFAGFLITAPETPEKIQTVEIYLLGVAKEFRKKGVATELITHAEKLAPDKANFYARCYPKSTWAISLLRKIGYRIESISKTSKVHYLRK
ncbi:GNAT family N-acetyltransferase [Limnohabitans lacus]|uniref:GNAT family N-acetyltransferase n=1 Tax=Limnohabitans lacus TaxID=3045173 RepID=A0ABT6XAN7_9BURK|nr:GNAT family N-acetyltransferase [Limnohabitans sp. HM2-2]MDI9235141.1 GNAT family N-acetyltransferase [Limnohabitans sp. HM2-2]